MTSNASRVVQLAVVALLTVALLAAAPASVMGATQTLAGDGTDTVSNFDASSTDFLNNQISADNTDFGTDNTDTVYMNVTYANDTHHEVSDTVASGDASYTFNISHADLETVPGAPNETTTVTVNTWGEGGDGTVNTSVSTFQVDLTFSDQRSVMYINDTSNAPVTTETKEPGLLSTDTLAFWSESEDESIVTIDEERAISGDQTDVHVYMDDSDVNSPFSTAAEDYSSSEDAVLGQTVLADDEPVPVFNEAANEDVVDASNDTHAVYDSDANRVTLKLGDDYSGESTVDTYAGSHDAFADTLDEDLTFEDINSAYNEELGVETFGEQFSVFEIGLRNWASSLW